MGQRLRLAGINPALLEAYGAGQMTLECLMAFSVTEDHARQVQVWDAQKKRGVVSNWSIRQTLTERTVSVGDPRTLFVGEDAYEAAGGKVMRDLFTERGEGWFEVAALLDRLAEAKLAEFGQEVAKEGWKWIEVSLATMSSRVYGLRVLPTRSELTEAEQGAYEAALAEREQLDEDHGYSIGLSRRRSRQCEGSGRTGRLHAPVSAQGSASPATFFLKHAGEVPQGRSWAVCRAA